MDALLVRLSEQAKLLVLAAVVTGCGIHTGCTSTGFGKQDTREIDLDAGTTVQLIDDLARPWGLKPIRAQGVSLVVGLGGSGGDPSPSSERAMLLDEMRTRDVDKPNQVLASKDTALVTVQALLPPGIQKGDRVDVEVRVPARGNSTSLRGGWLMETRLLEYARLPNRIATGHLIGLARGDVLIDALFQGEDDAVMLTRGRVLEGGVVAKSRNLGLVVRDQHLSVRTSARIGEAINHRFHIYDRGLQRPVATPKRDSFVELLVHPRYQENIIRYIRVIQSIPVREGAGGLAARLPKLEEELLHAPTSAAAALKLEALGENGVPVLLAGLASPDAEVMFYAAEALAYMNHSDAVSRLVEAIQAEPAFRWRAFTALGAMNDAESHDALAGLLHVDSAETRYGAFRALRKLLPDDPAIRGEILKSFHYHVLSSHGEPLIHATTAERPELVMFGTDQPLQHPVLVYAGDDIVVRSSDDEQITVTRFTPGEENQQVKCPPQLDAVIRSIVDLGGAYPDVVHAIKQAKRNGSIKSRVEFAAIPVLGRTYRRQAAAEDNQDERQQTVDRNVSKGGVKPQAKKFQPADPMNPLRDQAEKTLSFAPQPKTIPIRSSEIRSPRSAADDDRGFGGKSRSGSFDEFQLDETDPVMDLLLPAPTAPIIDKPTKRAPVVND